jgi:hypothetical protein
MEEGSADEKDAPVRRGATKPATPKKSKNKKSKNKKMDLEMEEGSADDAAGPPETPGRRQLTLAQALTVTPSF